MFKRWFSGKNQKRRAGRPSSGRSACQVRPNGLERLEDRTVMSADAVLDWNAIALEAVKNDHTPSVVATPDQGGPTRTARALAIESIAMYDAVNAIRGTYIAYAYKQRGPLGASIDAAASQAAHDTLVALYPKQKATFDAALVTSLAAIPDGLSETQGIAVGKAAAAAILALRAADHSNDMVMYTPGNLPGQHRPDPLHPAQGYLTPMWGDVTPFAMTDMRYFRAPPPPALSSVEYAAAFNEVKALGGDGVTTATVRTAEQTIIGKFWGYDGTPGLGTPPRLYNQIARTVSQQQNLTEPENARLFALVNIAMADAGIAEWDTKYVYNFWRPVVAIRESDPGTGPTGLGDGNRLTTGDPTWTPLGAPGSNGTVGGNFTPPFPAYASGHAAFGAAAFRSLAQFFGRDTIKFSFQSDEFNGVTLDANGSVRPKVTRTYNSFSQAALENAVSRIYLGIHWRFDATAGIRQGAKIADWTFLTLLRPVGFANGLWYALAGKFIAQGRTELIQNPLLNQNLFTFSGTPIVVAGGTGIVRNNGALPLADTTSFDNKGRPTDAVFGSNTLLDQLLLAPYQKGVKITKV